MRTLRETSEVVAAACAETLRRTKHLTTFAKKHEKLKQIAAKHNIDSNYVLRVIGWRDNTKGKIEIIPDYHPSGSFWTAKAVRFQPCGNGLRQTVIYDGHADNKRFKTIFEAVDHSKVCARDFIGKDVFEAECG